MCLYTIVYISPLHVGELYGTFESISCIYLISFVTLQIQGDDTKYNRQRKKYNVLLWFQVIADEQH